MIFGPTPLNLAIGTILAHSVQTPGGKLSKGVMLTAADITLLRTAGLTEVICARLEPGDIAEDAAAERLARALTRQSLGLRMTKSHTGRVNLFATRPGLLSFDARSVHDLNRVDPCLTFATHHPLTRVKADMLIGTVKLISYAARDHDLAQAEIHAAHSALTVLPLKHQTASLIMTKAPGIDRTTDKLSAKGRIATMNRLAALGAVLGETLTVAHTQAAISMALGQASSEVILIMTGAATSDLYDIAPNALRAAGGTVQRFGIPVDPGNLLFVGTLGSKPVIGLPGCARSSALNGADWVLERILCGVDLTDDMCATMGVGGLLKEPLTRPAPRLGTAKT